MPNAMGKRISRLERLVIKKGKDELACNCRLETRTRGNWGNYWLHVLGNRSGVLSIVLTVTHQVALL